MSPTPSGRLLRTPAGRDLVLVRTFRAPIEDVWASITESERTARWFGSWTGEPGPGRTVQMTMGFEQGAAPTDVTIEACEPPRHLAVRTRDSYGSWHLEAHLAEAGGVTELRFTHHLDAEVNVGGKRSVGQASGVGNAADSNYERDRGSGGRRRRGFSADPRRDSALGRADRGA